MKYILKVFKQCTVRYIPVSRKVFDKCLATRLLAGNQYYKSVHFDDLDLELQNFVLPFFD